MPPPPGPPSRLAHAAAAGRRLRRAVLRAARAVGPLDVGTELRLADAPGVPPELVDGLAHAAAADLVVQTEHVPQLAARVRVLRVPILPRHADGMTIGRWIFLTDDRSRAGDRTLLAHELVHVRQYAELGYLRFSWRYLRDYARGLIRLRDGRAAYLAIAAEVEARADAEAWRGRRRRTARPPA